MILNVLWSKEEGIHVRNLAFQIYLDLYTVADLTFDPVLETRYVDEKLIFLAILQLYKSSRTFGLVSKRSSTLKSKIVWKIILQYICNI